LNRPKQHHVGSKKSAQAALDSDVQRGNRLLRQFERANPQVVMLA
jgi:sn-glycerol 3-phosphate transport system substrate-binding protein